MGCLRTEHASVTATLAELRFRQAESTASDNNERTYVGVYRAGSDGYALYAGKGTDLFKKWETMSQRGLRLIDMETYTDRSWCETRKRTWCAFATLDSSSAFKKKADLDPFNARAQKITRRLAAYLRFKFMANTDFTGIICGKDNFQNIPVS
jgi:hypothetical protein